MAKGINRLTARAVATAAKPGRYADGGGLYLQVRIRGSKTVERLWLFRYKRGKRKTARGITLSLGPARDVSLAKARDLAGQCRSALLKGDDPRTVLIRTSDVPNFGDFASDVIDSLVPGFKNAKHAAQWRMTLGDAYCRTLRRLPVDKIGTDDVLSVLRPIWLKRHVTATRLRGRIEKVLDAAKVRGFRTGENPARWRGHLDHLLAKPEKNVKHHEAIAWTNMPMFYRELQASDTIAAAALEWTILTAARIGETIGTPMSEINKAEKIWVVPAHRMKGNREHRVPLCDRCMEILDEMTELGSTWLFPGKKLSRSISESAVNAFFDTLKTGATIHGFRSTFKDWAWEARSFQRELVEECLAHLVGNEVERAYRRGDALERRREIMNAWSRYCEEGSGNVIQIRQLETA